VTDGLWGGYHHVEAARDFIHSTLYQSRYAARNLLQLRARIDPHKLLSACTCDWATSRRRERPLTISAPPIFSAADRWLCALARCWIARWAMTGSCC